MLSAKQITIERRDYGRELLKLHQPNGTEFQLPKRSKDWELLRTG